MKKTWDVSRIDIVHSMITTEEYQQLLDEWAEIVYRHLCQLHDDHSKVPNFNSASNEQERTATYG